MQSIWVRNVSIKGFCSRPSEGSEKSFRKKLGMQYLKCLLGIHGTHVRPGCVLRWCAVALVTLEFLGVPQQMLVSSNILSSRDTHNSSNMTSYQECSICRNFLLFSVTFINQIIGESGGVFLLQNKKIILPPPITCGFLLYKWTSSQ